MVFLVLIGLGFFLFSAGCSVLGIRSGYEEAGYTLIDKRDGVEIREYEELLVVETKVDAAYKSAGNVAFRRLFKYITGNNASRSKIAMTTPVIADEQVGENIAMTTPVIGEESAEGGWRYAFVLPSSFTMDTAPIPNDPAVKIAVVPSRKVAVLRYAGTWKETAMRSKVATLEQWIEESEFEAVSEPRSAGYDPPWTIPPLRRNEVLIDIR